MGMVQYSSSFTYYTQNIVLNQPFPCTNFAWRSKLCILINWTFFGGLRHPLSLLQSYHFKKNHLIWNMVGFIKALFLGVLFTLLMRVVDGYLCAVLLWHIIALLIGHFVWHFYWHFLAVFWHSFDTYNLVDINNTK